MNHFALTGKLLTSALCASLLLAACGDGAGTATTTERTGATTATPTSVTISIAKMQFQPATVSVHAGDTVIFMNNDVVAHDATALPDSAWSSGMLQPGDSWKVVIEAPTDYFCSIHQVMKGTINMD